MLNRVFRRIMMKKTNLLIMLFALFNTSLANAAATPHKVDVNNSIITLFLGLIIVINMMF